MLNLILPSLPFAGLALVLGFKHSFDADHVVAVSGLLRRSRSLKESAAMSISWSVGHMATAAIITALLFAFKDSILAQVLSHFELLVGVMLVVIGAWSLRELFILHKHPHSHGKVKHAHAHLHTKSADGVHFHKHFFGIGLVHGLASNDELLLLLTAELGLTSLAGMLVGTAIFSVGVVLGMMLFSLAFTFPLLKAHSEGISRGVTLLTGVASVGYGAMMLLGV